MCNSASVNLISRVDQELVATCESFENEIPKRVNNLAIVLCAIAHTADTRWYDCILGTSCPFKTKTRERERERERHRITR